MLKKHLLAYLMPNIAQAIASFGTVAILTRLLTDAEYGRFSLIFTTMTIAHYIVMNWAEAAAARFYARAEANGEINNHFKTLIVAFTFNAALFVVLGALVSIFYPGDMNVKLALAAAFGGSIVRSLLKIALETRRMNLESMHYSMVETFNTLAGFALTAVFVVWLNLKEEGPFIATMVAAAMALVIEGPFLKKLSSGGKFEIKLAKEYFHFGWGISGGLLLATALSVGDRYFIAYFLDDAAVGVYSAGYQIAARILDILFVYITGVGFPLLVSAFEKGTKEDFKIAAINSCNLRVAIGVPAAVGIALVSKPLADILIGESLRAPAAQITPYIAAGALFWGLSDYFSDAFVISRKVFERAIIMTIPAILNMILNIILLPKMGIMGAAWSTIIAYFIGMVILALRGRKYIKMPIPWLDIAKVGVSCVLMALAVMMVGRLGGFLELFVKATVGAITYGAAAVILNFANFRGHALEIFTKLKGKLNAG